MIGSYNLSVYLKIFELLLPLKVKLRSHKFKCDISMNNGPITKFFYRGAVSIE